MRREEKKIILMIRLTVINIMLITIGMMIALIKG